MILILRLIVFIAVIPLSGCWRLTVGDVKQTFRFPEYSQELETDLHFVQVRYLPRTLRLLERAALDSATPMTVSLLDSLEYATGGAKGLLFLMRLVPKDSNQGTGFDGDLIYGKSRGFATVNEAYNFFAFGLKSRIWLEVAGKKIPLIRYQMEESFGMNRSRNFILIFPQLTEDSWPKNQSVELVFDNILPGLSRRKMAWTFPLGKYDESV